jgi:hypothetical protein
MLVCNISLRPPRRAIAAELAEATIAADATATGNVVFATLVDDPASVRDNVDAYLGEIMLEAASAADTFNAGLEFATAIVEPVTALDFINWSTAVATTTYDGTPSAGIVRSNGNLTVTHGTTNNGVGVTSTAFLTAGKFYFEDTVQVSTFGGNHLGLYQSGTFASAVTTGKATAVVVGASSNIYTNGANTTKNLGTTAVGDVFGFAIDLTSRLAWICRNNGLWNADATADPVTGVGGVTIATGSFTPYVAFTNGAATNAFTGNFGQTAYANAAPSGFGFWQ